MKAGTVKTGDYYGSNLNSSERRDDVRCRYTANVPAILSNIAASLLVTKYEDYGAVLFICEDRGSLRVLARRHRHSSGIAIEKSNIAIGARCEVIIYHDYAGEVFCDIPAERDGCYIPYVRYIVGDLGIREMAYGDAGLYMASSLLSCIGIFSENQQFTPYWRPSFISAIRAEDRCHLNGIAIADGEPAYVSAIAVADSPQGWRAKKLAGGVVVEVSSAEVMSGGLCMPHSPRLHDGKLWILESGNGSLGCIDLNSGKKETIFDGTGFCRGLAIAGNYAFVGVSRARGDVFRGLPVDGKRVEYAGLQIIDIANGRVAGWIEFDDRVSEIFDVQLLLGYRYPEIARLESGLADAPRVHNGDVGT